MEKWNDRLAAALAESHYNANQLAKELKVSAPTVSAWIGAAGITPARDIKGENLLLVCRLLNVRPEWLMFREGQMRPAPMDNDVREAIDLMMTLPSKARQLVLVQIKGYADLTSEKVNHVTAEKAGTISHPTHTGELRQATVDQQGVTKHGDKNVDLDEVVAGARRLAGVEGASRSTNKKGKQGSSA